MSPHYTLARLLAGALTIAALACALFVFAMSGAAAAQPSQDTSASTAPARSQPTWGSFESIATTRSAAARPDPRSPDVRDAAANARKQDLRHLRAGGHPVNAPGATAVDSATRPAPPGPLSGPPTWPAEPQPITHARTATLVDGENGIAWTTIGLGIAGSLLAVTGLAALNSRRVQRARVTA